MNSSWVFNRKYIFVEFFEKLLQNIRILRGNAVMCSNCNECLGGAIFRGYIGERDVVRFSGHQIFRKKTYLDIYRVININENENKILRKEYYTEINCVRPTRVAEL